MFGDNRPPLPILRIEEGFVTAGTAYYQLWAAAGALEALSHPLLLPSGPRIATCHLEWISQTALSRPLLGDKRGL